MTNNTQAHAPTMDEIMEVLDEIIKLSDGITVEGAGLNEAESASEWNYKALDYCGEIALNLYKRINETRSM